MKLKIMESVFLELLFRKQLSESKFGCFQARMSVETDSFCQDYWVECISESPDGEGEWPPSKATLPGIKVNWHVQFQYLSMRQEVWMTTLWNLVNLMDSYTPASLRGPPVQRIAPVQRPKAPDARCLLLSYAGLVKKWSWFLTFHHDITGY